MLENRTKYPKKKAMMYQQIQELQSAHRVMAMVKMEKIRSSQILQLRKMMKDDVTFLNVKDRIARKALESIDTAGVLKFTERLTGQRMLVLTNMSPFRLNLLLAKNKVMLAAKAGDVASIDVVVKEQNTGIAPGPMLSEFKDAKIPTKIDQGTIWIMKDTTPVKQGEVISEQLAPLLSKLNIKPVEARITLECALEDGVLFDHDDLMVDTDAIRDSLAIGSQEALSLAIEAAYMTRESAAGIVAKASQAARNLSTESGYVTDETAGAVLQRAHARGVALAEQAADYTPS